MKKLTILLSALLFSLNIYSQGDYISYYLKINEANKFYKQNLFFKSDSIFDISFSSVMIIHPVDYIKAAVNACKIDSLNKVKKYLLIAASAGYPLNEIAKHKSSLIPFFNSQYWKEFKNDYKKVRERYETRLNLELGSCINNMYENDQKYRGWSYSKNLGKQNLFDSLNLVEIKKMQMQYGKIPGINELGYEGMMLLYIIFRHVNDRYSIDTLGPQIISQSKNGDFPPYMGPGIIDYKALMQVSSKQFYMTCQTYGTQIMTTPKTRTRVIIPVKDIESVNILREGVGLEKMEDYTTTIYNENLVREECGEMFEFCNQ